MVGSEVFSSEVKKTEVLMENFRRAIGSFWASTFYFSILNELKKDWGFEKLKKFTKVKSQKWP